MANSRRTYAFVGIPSGDHEAFCWAVTKDEYVKVTGKPPKHCGNPFHENTYCLYPDDLHEHVDDDEMVEVKITVKGTKTV